jgi:uncharacterized membrane protein YeiH
VRRLAVAALVAFAIFLFMAVPRIAGVETWKWLLAAVGLTIFVLAGATR